MRTMPMLEASSVEVASTARAQRMQRSSTTEATGWAMMGSMLRRGADDVLERSESEDEQEEDDSKCWVGGREDIVVISIGGLLGIYVVMFRQGLFPRYR